MDRRWLLAGAVAVLALAAGAWYGRGVTPPVAPISSAPVTVPSGPVPTTDALVVHLTGWVVHPGLVKVPAGSRVGDVLAAAGGARPGAALDSVNLAEPVVDGQQVVVPGPGEPTPAQVEAGPNGAGGPIRLNTANPEQLESLPGVGPVLAERIVAHREANGPFEVIEDLLEVSGIGESKLASIRDLVVVP